YKLRFAPIKDHGILAGILDKGLASITPGERRNIYSRWIHLEQSSTLPKTMIWVISVSLTVVFFVVVAVIGWNRSLRAVVDQKTRELRKEVQRHEQAKQKIEENENRYRGIFEYTKSGVIVYKAVDHGKNFIVLDSNRSVFNIDRLHREEILGKSILKIFPGAETFGLFTLIQKVWETGVPAHLPAACYKDDRIQGWRDYFVYKLPSNEVVTVYSDETSRIIAENALRQSEEQLSGIIHSINDPMVMLDRSLNILWGNPAAKIEFGNRIDNQKCYVVFAGLDSPCEGCIALECFDQEKMLEREINVKNRDGEDRCFWEITNIASLDFKGTPKAVVTVFRDITQRNALAAEAMRAGHLASIGELAAGVAHEINNPINSIINLAQIITNDGRKVGESNEMALRIISEGKRIAGIVSSLLAFARERTGPETPMTLEDILSETLALTRAHLDKNGIILELDISPDLPVIHGHIQKIQQVFLNIINNARYALNQTLGREVGGKLLQISGRKIVKENRTYVRTVFEDNGTGISKKNIGRVADPFFSTKPSGMGTGLGLSISHGIVGKHGGDIQILSRENEYTKVIIDLPAGDKS
ncbi:MAG: ATP-binding protein, partial [Desulfobacterales bacterium]|nr:ATP-binding protein [Desulfobacterales bacterium]